ncbi:hypothetical protein HYV81_04710 [Candidatus Woesearchaeota archaeon]|nr:hypothetical protein [Candidatus Woesearchaeota archaeon]
MNKKLLFIFYIGIILVYGCSSKEPLIIPSKNITTNSCYLFPALDLPLEYQQGDIYPNGKSDNTTGFQNSCGTTINIEESGNNTQRINGNLVILSFKSFFKASNYYNNEANKIKENYLYRENNITKINTTTCFWAKGYTLEITLSKMVCYKYNIAYMIDVQSKDINPNDYIYNLSQAVSKRIE